jgi:hypothetical protein
MPETPKAKSGEYYALWTRCPNGSSACVIHAVDDLREWKLGGDFILCR